ncbi:MAG: DUF945 family protein [Cardiobacterium sp.]
MIKRTLAFIAVIWLIIAILAPSFIAPQIEGQLRAFLDGPDALRLRGKGLELQLEHYQRGYFSSQAELHVSFRPYSGQPTWYSTTLHARINHAPLFNSGINLVSASITNGKSDGRFAAYLPENHLQLQTRIAILGQIHQFIRIAPNRTANLDSDGLTLGWHSHIRTPGRGNGEWLLGKQQWLEGRRSIDLARSSGTYRSDGETLRLSAAQINLSRRDISTSAQQDITLYNLQGDLTRAEQKYNIEDISIKDKGTIGKTANQRLQHSTITLHRRDNGSLRNLEAQTSPTFDLPVAKALNGDRLYLSLQQEADGNRLIISSNREQTTHISGSLLFPLLFPPPYNIAQLNGTRGEFVLYGDFARDSGLLPLLTLALGKDRLPADGDGNYPLQIDVNGDEVRVNGKALLMLR